MDKKTLLVGLGSILLIGLVAVGTLFFGGSGNFRGTLYAEPYPPAPDFELSRASGDAYRLSENMGKVRLLFFGYTSCPDICPTTMAELKQTLEKIGDKDSRQVQVLFVTVDPKRDTPERVQEYVNHFNSAFIGLSGSEISLAKVWSDYGIFRLEVPGASAAGYTVDHTARITLIDRNGNLRVSFGFDTPVENIVHDVKLVLREKE